MTTSAEDFLPPTDEALRVMGMAQLAVAPQAILMEMIGSSSTKIATAALLTGAVAAATHPEWASLLFRAMADGGPEREAQLLADARKLVAAIPMEGMTVKQEEEA